MDFVDGQRRLEPVFLGATRHPRRVSPGIVVKARDDRTGVRPELGAKAVGIGFERQDGAIRGDDLVFVNRAFVELGREEFPNAGGAARAHQVHAAVPAIEIADDADAARARRPDRSEEHTSELQSLAYLVCRLLLEKKNTRRSSTDD